MEAVRRFLGEAERQIARRLQVEPSEVVGLSQRLWGRSLTEERDARSVGFKGNPEGRAMHRAHISRRLQQELLEAREHRGSELETTRHFAPTRE